MVNNSINSDLIRGHIDTIVLHSLTKCDMHAQQISDFIEQKSNNQYKINQATLYSSLKRLENLKFVSSYFNDSDTGRRKFFHILDKGVSYVNENLALWSESKSILDKLMDMPTEKVVYVTHNDTKNSQENTNNSVNSNIVVEKPSKTTIILPLKDENEIKNTVVSPVNTDLSTKKVETIDDDTKEINFRAILNSLIKTKETTEITPENVDVNEKNPEALNVVITETDSPATKLKFNETISGTDYNAQKSNNDGKIDFGDLTIKAEKEGYKIRISSKYASKSNGFIFVNKLKFFTSFIMFFVAMVEFALFKLFTPYIFTNISTIISLLVITCAPLFNAIKVIANKNKKTTKKYTADSVLVCAIVLFNLILVNLAILFILNVELSVSFNLISYFIVPLCVYLDIVLYYVIQTALSKAKKISSNK
jgi:PadR family transcriptional regulator PadR